MKKMFLYNTQTSPKVEKYKEPERPKTLGSGFVTSVLGEGGAAVVYEIWNPKLEIHRAVKLWRPNVSEKDLQRFETEIKITSKLDHPNIVEIHSVGEWNGLPYIEMERVDGLSLQQILKTSGSLPPVVAVAIMMFICRALFYAHLEEFSLYGRKRKGVIHCDIKPANIMVTRNGLVKLMDFGIANPTNVSLHTASDRVTGSLQYMAPEQIRSRQIDARTDIYSAGTVFYEMLSGSKAFPSKQLLDVIEKRKVNEYVPLNQLCVNLPRRLYRIVTRCMQLEPEDRYQQVNELLKELTATFKTLSHNDPQAVIKQFLDIGSVPVHKIQISRNILIPLLAGIIPTIFLIFTLFMTIFKDDPKNSRTAAIGANTTPPAITTQVTPEQPQVPDTVQQEPALPANQDVQPDVTTQPQSIDTSTQTQRLDYLQNMVEQGNMAGALTQFSIQAINDGAYYSLYARCLYESGKWEKAFEMAQIATKVPSKRIGKDVRQGQYLLYKAKYLSFLFDEDHNDAAARTAITAWWDVREYFNGTAKAVFADGEIDRLSAYIEGTN